MQNILEINGTYFNEKDQAELVNLYHLAMTALAHLDHVPTRHERLIWASSAYAKERDIPSVRAYKALTRLLA